MSTCAQCGARAGAASVFRRGICAACQSERSRRKGTKAALWHIILLVSGIVVYATSGGASTPMDPFAFMVLAFAFLDIVFIGVTLVHETAHALTALALGFGLREVSIGAGPTLASFRFGHTRLVFNLYPVGGHTLALPRGANLRRKMFAVTAVGPLSHIPVAAWLATLSAGNDLWDLLLAPTPEMVMMYFLVNVVPVFENDGRTLARLFTMSEDQVGAMGSAVASISELVPTLDDPVAHPPHRAQRDTVLAHLGTPGLTPADRAFALNNLAVVDVLLDDPDLLDEADEASREAYELMPDHPALQNTRGSVLILLGDFPQGIALMKPTMTRLPAETLGESHLDLAYAHVRLGQPFEARDHLHAASDRNARPRLFAVTLAGLGALETGVIRRFAQAGESPEATAIRFRRAAGPQAVTTGAAIVAHIEDSGEDTDLTEIARALSGSS